MIIHTCPIWGGQTNGHNGELILVLPQCTQTQNCQILILVQVKEIYQALINKCHHVLSCPGWPLQSVSA